MSDFPLIYANIILGLTSRNPGVFQITLGTTGFGTMGEPTGIARESVGLALPVDTAQALAIALTNAIRSEEDAKPESEEDHRYKTLKANALRQSMVMLGMKDFMTSLIRDAKDRPDIRDRLAVHAASAVRSIKGIETVGLDISEETELLGAAIAELEEWLVMAAKDLSK